MLTNVRRAIDRMDRQSTQDRDARLMLSHELGRLYGLPPALRIALLEDFSDERHRAMRKEEH